MCGNLYVIVKENVKVVLRQGAWAAVLFLFVVPHLYGIANLNGEKAADCLGRLVAFVGIPLFVPLSKPEQVSGLRDVILVKEFPYRISIFLRVVFAALLSAVFICIFEQYMRYRGCDFPTVIYTVRTAGVSMLAGGVGLLGSALFRRTLVGIRMSVGFVFLCYDNFTGMVLEGVSGFVLVMEVLVYGSVLLLCKE